MGYFGIPARPAAKVEFALVFCALMSICSGRLEYSLVPGAERSGGVRNRVAEPFRFSAALERLPLENALDERARS